MDFLKIIQSLDEILYEIVSWLLFYPITLWRMIRSPVRMMLSAEKELAQTEAKQFDDVIAPPLFLLLTLVLIHVVELALVGRVELAADNPEFSQLISSDFNLTAFRVVALSLLPLAAAVRLVRARGEWIDRPVLKAPFYAQCYAAALFAVGLALAFVSTGSHFSFRDPGFLPIIVAALLWLYVVEAHWFAEQLKLSLAKGFEQATVLLLQWVACWSSPS